MLNCFQIIFEEFENIIVLLLRKPTDILYNNTVSVYQIQNLLCIQRDCMYCTVYQTWQSKTKNFYKNLNYLKNENKYNNLKEDI